MGFSRHSFQSFGTLEASQERSSSRNCNSSLVRFRSMSQTPSDRVAHGLPLEFCDGNSVPSAEFLCEANLCETSDKMPRQSSSRAGLYFGYRYGSAGAHGFLALPIFFADVLFQNFSRAGLGETIHEFE